MDDVPGAAAGGSDSPRQLTDRVHDDVGLPVDRPGDQALGAAEGSRTEQARDECRDPALGRDVAEVANRLAKRGIGLGPAGPDVPRRQTTPGRFVATLPPRRDDDLVSGPVGGLRQGKQR